MREADDYKDILVEIMKNQKYRCPGGEHFKAAEAVQHEMNLTEEEFDEFTKFLSEIVARVAAQKLLAAAFGKGGGPEEMVEMIFEIVVPATMLVTNQLVRDDLAGKKAEPTSKYTSTVMAEALVRSFLTEDKDLNDIWPVDIAENVTREFDPVKAFMVGVVCGGWHG